MPDLREQTQSGREHFSLILFCENRFRIIVAEPRDYGLISVINVEKSIGLDHRIDRSDEHEIIFR